MSALLDLKTKLKDLKFGNDQPQYGSSDQPYVQTYIPKTPLLLNLTGPGYPLYTPGGTSWGSDYPIRGGQIKFQVGQDTFTVSNDIDKTRIAMFLNDKQRGTMFIQKQIGLQLSNPKIETGKATLFGVGQIVPLSGLLENTRVYNRGINTLAQVGVSGTGVHAVRHGNIPFNPFQDNYYSTVNKQNVFGNEMGSKINRLVMLTALKMMPDQNANFVNPLNFPIDVNVANSLGISYNKNLLFQYLGGPGSTYGVGSTTINRYVDTSYLADQNPKVPNEIKNKYIKYGKYNTAGEIVPTNKLNVEAKPESPVSNRLLLLKESKISGTKDSYGDYAPSDVQTLNVPGLRIGGSPSTINFSSKISQLKDWGISLNNRLLFYYDGGPGAITKNEETGQITVDKENTGIRRYTDTTLVSSNRTMTYASLANQSINDAKYKTHKDGVISEKNMEIQDFRQGLTSDGFRWKESDSLDYKFYLPKSKVDKLNSLYPIYFDNSKAPWEVDVVSYKSSEDIIKFVFEAVSNNNPSISTALFFRAFLTSQISDNNTATWNSFKYAGRGENFYTYQGFERNISFAFRAYASSEQEMKAMYNRLNNLISQVYPDYSADNIMRAPIMRLTIGDYINRMPGFLQNVNITVDQNSSWEILDDATHSQLPHMVDVNVTFIPILSELPRRANTLKDPYMPSIIANNGKMINPILGREAPAEDPGVIVSKDPTLNENELANYLQKVENNKLSKYNSLSEEYKQDRALEEMVANIGTEESDPAGDPLPWHNAYVNEYALTKNDMTGTTTAFPD